MTFSFLFFSSIVLVPPGSEGPGGRGLVGVAQPISLPRPFSRFFFYSALELVPESDVTRFQIQTILFEVTATT